MIMIDGNHSYTESIHEQDKQSEQQFSHNDGLPVRQRNELNKGLSNYSLLPKEYPGSRNTQLATWVE